MSSNLPDNWSWRAFDQHFGDDPEPEDEERRVGFDICVYGVGFDEECEDCEEES